jgi:hypothetical protein
LAIPFERLERDCYGTVAIVTTPSYNVDPLESAVHHPHPPIASERASGHRSSRGALALLFLALLTGLVLRSTGPADGQAPSTWSSSATVNPSSVARGASVTIQVTVTPPRTQSALVDLEVYSPAGAKVFQRFWDNTTLTAGRPSTFTATWSVPANEATGTHVAKIGVFGRGWGTLHHWNNGARSFTVTTTTTPAPTTTAPPTTSAPAPTTTTTAAPTTTTTAPPPSSGLPARPRGFLATLQLGINDGAGGAATTRAMAPFGFRYQYLAGGVNTGHGWTNWGSDFVPGYVRESRNHGMIPVFTYYMLYQSSPGGSMGESSGIAANLNNGATMAAYYNDLRQFFQKAAAAGGTTVLHVEPDLWGYVQQRADSDDARTVPAKVGGSGMADVAGLPDNIAGFAQAIVRLRDRYAPNVVLGFHVSTWATGNDFIYSDPSDATVDALGVRSGRFYQSLGARFDVTFAEFTDRDAGFKQAVYGDGGASWYNANDYRRHVTWIGAFVRTARLRAVLWQIPFGNTKMRAVNNTWNHYQDNKVEWFLDEPARTHLDAYARAGVVAFLFGRGADGATCPCDANNDGVTNPAPINGNNRTSLNADDDGGYFRERANGYYGTGPLALPG